MASGGLLTDSPRILPKSHSQGMIGCRNTANDSFQGLNHASLKLSRDSMPIAVKKKNHAEKELQRDSSKNKPRKGHSKICNVFGHKDQAFEWKEMGIIIRTQAGTVPSNTKPCNIKVTPVIPDESCQMPDNSLLVSGIFEISATCEMCKPVKVELEHSVVLSTDALKMITFAKAKSSTSMSDPSSSKFTLCEGNFALDSQYGILECKTFSMFAIIFRTKIKLLLCWPISCVMQLLYSTSENTVYAVCTQNIQKITKDAHTGLSINDCEMKVSAVFQFAKDKIQIETSEESEDHQWKIEACKNQCLSKKEVVMYDGNQTTPYVSFLFIAKSQGSNLRFNGRHKFNIRGANNPNLFLTINCSSPKELSSTIEKKESSLTSEKFVQLAKNVLKEEQQTLRNVIEADWLKGIVRACNSQDIITHDKMMDIEKHEDAFMLLDTISQGLVSISTFDKFLCIVHNEGGESARCISKEIARKYGHPLEKFNKLINTTLDVLQSTPSTAIPQYPSQVTPKVTPHQEEVVQEVPHEELPMGRVPLDPSVTAFYTEVHVPPDSTVPTVETEVHHLSEAAFHTNSEVPLHELATVPTTKTIHSEEPSEANHLEPAGHNEMQVNSKIPLGQPCISNGQKVSHNVCPQLNNTQMKLAIIFLALAVFISIFCTIML